jgi:hypothetical protein
MKIKLTTLAELTDDEQTYQTQERLLRNASVQLSGLLKGLHGVEDARSEMLVDVTLTLQDRPSSRELAPE